MARRGRPPLNLSSKKDINKTISGKITKKPDDKTNKQKGNELEVQVYEALTRIGQVTVRYQDGHYDTDKDKYIPTGDGGVDLITITKEGVKIYVQCKNWGTAIGVGVIRSFRGALDKYIKEGDPDIGMIVANTFSDCAIREAETSRITILLTTVKSINKTILDVLSQIKINRSFNILIHNAQYLSIKKEGSIKIKAIGDNLKTDIKNV